MSTDFPDYPAAHSMDTTWWAVDAEGYVAKFSSGEAGAVPSSVGEPVYESDMFDRLAGSGFAGMTLFVDDLFDKPDGRLLYRTWDGSWDNVVSDVPSDAERGSGYLLWLRDESAVAALEARLAPRPVAKSIVQRLTSALTRSAPATASTWWVTRLPAEGKTVVWLDSGEGGGPPVDVVRRFIQEGIVLRGVLFVLSTLDMERLGFFVYEHNRFDNWIAGPYERSAPPKSPLRLADLPPEVSEVIGQCRLEKIEFHREPLVQPFDLGEAQCWSEEWVSSTGRRRRTDDGEPIASPSPTPCPIPKGNWRSDLAPLVALYLGEALGAEAVLNDYLEESGQSPLAAEPGAAQRLEAVVLRFFTSQEVLVWEAECLEHWVETDAPLQGADAVRAAIQTSKEFAAGRAVEAELSEAAAQAFAQWTEFEEEMTQPGTENRPAWAAWALASRMALVAARTAREVRPHEVSWQSEHVLRRLDQKFSAGN